MVEYWPWWLGALALGGLTVAYWYFMRRPLGVSGAWARAVMWKHDRQIEQAEAPFRQDPKMLRDALMAATIEAFGERAVNEVLERRRRQTGSEGPVTRSEAEVLGAMPHRTPWTAHLVFLVMLAAGGLIATLMHGGPQVRMDLGGLHRAFFGSGLGYWMTLFVGGALVGFGTQWANGCTSGHGLSGCARLVPASLAATATFFASAVAMSFLLEVTAGGA